MMNSAFDGAQAQPANASSRRGSGASRPLSPTVRPPTAASGQSSNPSANERRTYDGASDNRLKSYSLSSGNTLQSSSSNARAEDREKQRLVRTLPTWVQSYDEEDEVDEAADPTSHLLPPLPLSAQLAQHNHTPTIKHKSEPGRLYDSQRERTPVTISSPVAVDASRWQSFVKASAYPPTSAEGGQQVDEDWLQNNLPDLSRPWLTGAKEGDAEAESNLFTSKAKRKRWWKRSQNMILRNPIIPLIIRLNVWFFSLIALAVGGSVFHLSHVHDCSQRPSTIMAIVVDAVALVYIIYITYDEYTGKPLGLRPARAKMRLIFLDLFFIVFDSANLSLAFDALTDARWACENGSPNSAQMISKCNGGHVLGDICGRQKALTSVLLIALIAWLTTFAISVLRLVERVAQ